MKTILVILGLLFISKPVIMKRKCLEVADSTSQTAYSVDTTVPSGGTSSVSQSTTSDVTPSVTRPSDTSSPTPETTTCEAGIRGVVDDEKRIFTPLPDRPDPPVGVPTTCDKQVDFFDCSGYLKSACYFRTAMSYFDARDVCFSLGANLFVNGQDDVYPLSQFVDYLFWANEKIACTTTCLTKLFIVCEYMK